MDHEELPKHRAAQPARPLWTYQSGWTRREWALIVSIEANSLSGHDGENSLIMFQLYMTYPYHNTQPKKQRIF